MIPAGLAAASLCVAVLAYQDRKNLDIYPWSSLALRGSCMQVRCRLVRTRRGHRMTLARWHACRKCQKHDSGRKYNTRFTFNIHITRLLYYRPK